MVLSRRVECGHMEYFLTRRQLLAALPLGLLFGRGRAHALEDGRSTFAYQLDLSVLFSFLTLSLSGTVGQEIDRRSGKYRMIMEGKGTRDQHYVRRPPASSATGGSSLWRPVRSITSGPARTPPPPPTTTPLGGSDSRGDPHPPAGPAPPPGRRCPGPAPGPPCGRFDLGRAELRRQHARA